MRVFRTGNENPVAGQQSRTELADCRWRSFRVQIWVEVRKLGQIGIEDDLNLGGRQYGYGLEHCRVRRPSAEAAGNGHDCRQGVAF